SIESLPIRPTFSFLKQQDRGADSGTRYLPMSRIRSIATTILPYLAPHRLGKPSLHWRTPGDPVPGRLKRELLERLKLRGPLAKINSTNPLAKRAAFAMRHVLSALVQNQPGVLAHISGMLASRGFNIDSLAVGETEETNLSRMTFVVHGDDAELEQVRKQLNKIVTVVAVQDISSEDFVERDLMLIKVKSAPQQRMEVVLLVEMFRGRVVDISPENLLIEISGQERK